MDYVFISYVKEDQVAVELARCLEEAGFATWYFERDSIPGQGYLEETRHAIEGASAFLLLISRNSIRSFQVAKEVVRAHECNKRFIPVLSGISHEEFEVLRADWGQAAGDATSIEIPPEGCRSIVPRLIKGLEALGVSRAVTPLPPEKPSPSREAKPPRRSSWTWAGVLVLVLLLAAMAAVASRVLTSSDGFYDVSEAKWHPDQPTFGALHHDLETKRLRIDRYLLSNSRAKVTREAQIIFDTEQGALCNQGIYLFIQLFIPNQAHADQVQARWRFIRRTSGEAQPRVVWHHKDFDSELTTVKIPDFSTRAILSHIIERMRWPKEVKDGIAGLGIDSQEVTPQVVLGIVRNEWEFYPEDGSKTSELKLQLTKVHAVPYQEEWLNRLGPIRSLPTTPLRENWSWREVEIEEQGELAAKFSQSKLLNRLQPFVTNYHLDHESHDPRMRMAKYETAVEVLQLYR